MQFNIRLFEIAYQPMICDHSLLMAFKRDMIYQFLSRNWTRYRHLRPPFLMHHLVSFMRYAFETKRYVVGGRWRRSSAIEMMVTDKHIRAWQTFLETDRDYLICFEDDVVFKSDSVQRIADLLVTLNFKIPSDLVYVDLAGGLQHKDLCIAKLETQRDVSFRHYRKPVTNTACAYLMSRSLVIIFHDMLVKRPWLRLIGVDWLMNKMFMLMEEDGVQCHCLHADPSILKHGTFTNEYVSWQAP